MIKFYLNFHDILHVHLFKLGYDTMMCCEPLYALIMCVIVGDPKAYALLMDVVEEEIYCCSDKLAENDKRLICI